MKSPSVTDFRSYFLTLARYHVWATERLLEKIDVMPDDAYRRHCGLFFKSVHGTLNPQSLPFAPTLGHVFNHATHHRGQVTTAILLQAESREAASS